MLQTFNLGESSDHNSDYSIRSQMAVHDNQNTLQMKSREVIISIMY